MGAANGDDLVASGRAAAAAAQAWASATHEQRAEVLRRVADLLHTHADEFRHWLQRESGKVRTAAKLELSLAEEEIRQAVTIADEIMRTMTTHKVSRLPVIDGHDLVGMVAQADVARALPSPQVGELLEALSTD